MTIITRLAPVALLFAAACSDVEEHDDQGHNHGLITKLVLNFTPTGDGDPLSFEWSDPENDGDPIIDEVVLPDASDPGDHAAQEYTLDVEVYNQLEDPEENVTPEVEETPDEHQFFFTGSAVQGPATGDNSDAIIEHAYADTDPGGLPIGLSNTITTLTLGTGPLTVTLRHMPPENNQPVKVAGLAQDVAEGGFGAIGGENDVQVTFPTRVGSVSPLPAPAR